MEIFATTKCVQKNSTVYMYPSAFGSNIVSSTRYITRDITLKVTV